MASMCITMNPIKTVAFPAKGHVPTLEEIALLEGIDVRIAERGGVWSRFHAECTGTTLHRGTARGLRVRGGGKTPGY